MLETSTIGYNKYLKLLDIYSICQIIGWIAFFFFFRSTPFYIPNGFIWATTCANPEVSLHYVVLPFDYFCYYWSSDEFTFCRLPVRQFHGETVFYWNASYTLPKRLLVFHSSLYIYCKLALFLRCNGPDSVSRPLLWSGGEFPETEATVDTCVNPQLIWITLSFFKCTFWLMCCAESDDFTYLPFTRQTTWWWEPWELKISDNWSLCWPLCCQVLPLNCPHQIEQLFVLPGEVVAQPLGTFECWLHETPRR